MITNITDVNKYVQMGADKGLAQIIISDTQYDGRHVTIEGKKKLFFGNCSYLGLGIDSRIKEAGIKAIQKFGVQYSNSKAYSGLNLYDTLERKLEEIFGYPTIVSQTTSLGHMSVMPVMVGTKDLIVLDKQVHSSVSNAAFMVKGMIGAKITGINHSDLAELEKKLIEEDEKYEKIWYMVDGIYSMIGDKAPLAELRVLQNKYPKLYLYVDDAHGMSWSGNNGRGYALEVIDLNDRTIMLTSFAKGFGVYGAAIVVNNPLYKEWIRNCGPALLFSGHMQPAALASAIASAKIHLSKEIITLQESLQERIHLFRKLCNDYELPLISPDNTPILFIGGGSTETSCVIGRKMLDAGFFLNTAIYPLVPHNHTGLRVTMTNYLQLKDIKRMIPKLAFVYKVMVDSGEINLNKIYEDFQINQNLII